MFEFAGPWAAQSLREELIEAWGGEGREELVLMAAEIREGG
jgi:hypothetical protein